MAPGNTVEESTGGPIATVSYTTGNMSETVTIDVFQDAFAQISTLLESLFSRRYSPYIFTMNIHPRGVGIVETGVTIPSSVYDGSGYPLLSGAADAENVGDLRMSMISLDGVGSTLAYAYSPSADPAVIGNVLADSRFDKDECWRVDTVSEYGCFSLLYVGIHEFLHSFAMGHDSTANSIMRPFVSTADSLINYPGGLVGTQEYFTVHKVYAGNPLVVALGSRDIYVLSTSIMNPVPSGKIQLPGALIDVAVSAQGYIWGTGRDNLIYFRSGVTTASPTGTGWVRTSGRLTQITSGYHVYGVNTTNRVYIRTGRTNETPEGTDWSRLGGRLSFIVSSQATNDQGLFSVFGCNSDGLVYYLNGVTFANGKGTTWSRLTGANVTQLAVGWFGRIVYCVTRQGRIYIRVGISSITPQGTEWSRIESSVAMKAIGISPTGEVYAVGTDRILYYRGGITSLNVSGDEWVTTGRTNLDRVASGLLIG
jgi:hypothetical protein